MRPLIPVRVISLAVPVVAARAAAGASAPIALEDDEPAPGEPPPEPPPEPPAKPEKDAGKPDAPKPEFPPCIEVRATARHNATGFDHVVSIANGCEQDADCQVTTDVNPELIAVNVPKGESRDLVTFRGSPSREFHARVRCELQN